MRNRFGQACRCEALQSVTYTTLPAKGLELFYHEAHEDHEESICLIILRALRELRGRKLNS